MLAIECWLPLPDQPIHIVLTIQCWPYVAATRRRHGFGAGAGGEVRRRPHVAVEGERRDGDGHRDAAGEGHEGLLRGARGHAGDQTVLAA